ncbi:Phytochelatin synthase-domain-containing protein [Gamsiella multidivaricata]|uniref:Phytochelatin synthase-domain-containing protein n=1 Tax=Gamsiella multidivaricata TaxID=101098 RepID=UPI00221F45A4|nr:Phytochelatin synthase-domain-containing protein [Gamsiella multidivaricata]KAI7823828.1 Phytochelatin synthase-domain-containing protein [Gamsiella multidivaricata]
MATNCTRLATKKAMARTLSSNCRFYQGGPHSLARQSCGCHIYLRQRTLASPSRAFFSTCAKSLKPTTSSPMAAPAVSSPRSAHSIAAQKTSVSSSNTAHSAVAAAAAAVASNRPLNSLPFSYDPTGLSAQAVKKPSCDNINLKNSFYRRKLPEHLVSFTSPEGKQLFREMLEEGYGEGYFSLVGNFTTQSEPAFCGPSSLAMVLNSLEVDPQRQWKGAWRWYSDELLECCAPVDQVKAKGITFNQFACLSKCHCDVQVRRANQVSLEQFKQDLEMVCSRDDIHMVVSFSRKALGQTGDGHFSPIGGYVPKAGMVLVLDTARFKYPSYFVSVERLYKSLFPIDVETGASRGYFLLSANPDQPAISLCKIPKSSTAPSSSSYTTATTTSPASTAAANLDAATKDLQKLNIDTAAAPSAQDIIRNASNTSTPIPTTAGPYPTTTTTTVSGCTSTVGATNPAANTIDAKMSWTSLAQTFCKDLPSRIQTENPQTLDHMVSVVLQGVPREYAFWISQQQAHRLRDTSELIDSIKSTELYTLVSSAFPAPVTADGLDLNSQEARLARQQHEGALVFGTLFLMSSPSTLFLTLPVEVSKQFEELRGAALGDEGQKHGQHRVLKEEVERMRSGVVELVNSFCCCGTKTVDIAEK